MPPELSALIDAPWLLAAVLAVGAMIGMAVERVVEGWNRAERRERWQARRRSRDGSRPSLRLVPTEDAPPSVSKVSAAAEQLRAVMEASFTARPLFNAGERRLLKVIDEALAAECPDWRAMGQVALGEILASKDAAAFAAINAKRVDILIVDRDSRALHAVELQGSGHFLSPNTAARDAVKREALRRAGIGFVEVKCGDTPADVRAIVRRLVQQASA